METTYRLITIPPSHYCEKARWALDRAGVEYLEERHPPVLHYPACRRARAGRTVPVLVTDLGVFPDSTDILRFVDSRHRAQAPLYPEDDGLRREVDELEELFDTRLGPHSRRLAYFYLLPERRLVFETVFDGVSKRDRILFRSTFPVIRLLMRKGMRITKDSAMRSLDRVREVFETVDERLADGRRYLVGESFSAADLSFAALAAPLLLPRGYRCRLPSLADLPAPLLPLVDEFRSSVAGGFALRLFRDER